MMRFHLFTLPKAYRTWIQVKVEGSETQTKFIKLLNDSVKGFDAELVRVDSYTPDVRVYPRLSNEAADLLSLIDSWRSGKLAWHKLREILTRDDATELDKSAFNFLEPNGRFVPSTLSVVFSSLKQGFGLDSDFSLSKIEYDKVSTWNTGLTIIYGKGSSGKTILGKRIAEITNGWTLSWGEPGSTSGISEEDFFVGLASIISDIIFKRTVISSAKSRRKKTPPTELSAQALLSKDSPRGYVVIDSLRLLYRLVEGGGAKKDGLSAGFDRVVTALNTLGQTLNIVFVGLLNPMGEVDSSETTEAAFLSIQGGVNAIIYIIPSGPDRSIGVVGDRGGVRLQRLSVKAAEAQGALVIFEKNFANINL